MKYICTDTFPFYNLKLVQFTYFILLKMEKIVLWSDNLEQNSYFLKFKFNFQLQIRLDTWVDILIVYLYTFYLKGFKGL